jgi:hypothetical protein
MIVYEIRVKGHLDPHWSAWFNGLTISHEEDGRTLFVGSSLMKPRCTVC